VQAAFPAENLTTTLVGLNDHATTAEADQSDLAFVYKADRKALGPAELAAST
jgi:hypothetical protein